jgi:trans-aconitate methyltransferase
MSAHDPAVEPIRYVWEYLTHARKPGEDGYFEHARTELLDLFERRPRHLIDVGCGTGVTGAEAKRRFPEARVDGFEFSPDAGAVAAGRLDRVHVGNVEQMDFAALGYAEGSIDALLLADVLEHLYNPWQLLVRLRPLLAPDAQIVASIPNARNLVLMSELAEGRFPYVPAGLLDVTHIRFFTLREMVAMFNQTGYEVGSANCVYDPRIPPMGPITEPMNIETSHLTFKNVDAALLSELTAIQFYLRARPRAAG